MKCCYSLSFYPWSCRTTTFYGFQSIY